MEGMWALERQEYNDPAVPVYHLPRDVNDVLDGLAGCDEHQGEDVWG